GIVSPALSGGKDAIERRPQLAGDERGIAAGADHHRALAEEPLPGVVEPRLDLVGEATYLLGVLAVPGVDELVHLVQVKYGVAVSGAGEKEVFQLVRTVRVFQDLEQIAHDDGLAGLARDAADRGGLAGPGGSQQQDGALVGTDFVQPGLQSGGLGATL